MFGAGHNALGAWWWLADAGRLALRAPSTTLAQQLGDRVLPVEIMSNVGKACVIGMVQIAPSFGAVRTDLRAMADALRATESDFLVNRLPAQAVSTGASHLLVPARHRAAVDSARPDAECLAALLQTGGGKGCDLYCLEPLDPAATAYARFFNPNVGIWEVQATGSAAGPLACHLAACGIVDETADVVVEQGHAMGRPSRIQVCRREAMQVFGGGVLAVEGTVRIRAAEPWVGGDEAAVSVLRPDAV